MLMEVNMLFLLDNCVLYPSTFPTYSRRRVCFRVAPCVSKSALSSLALSQTLSFSLVGEQHQVSRSIGRPLVFKLAGLFTGSYMMKCDVSHVASSRF